MACSIPDTLGTGCRRTEMQRSRATRVTGHLPLLVPTGRPSCAWLTARTVTAPSRLSPDCDLKLALWKSLYVRLLFLKRKKKKNMTRVLPSLFQFLWVYGGASGQGNSLRLLPSSEGHPWWESFCPSLSPLHQHPLSGRTPERASEKPHMAQDE